MKSYFRSTFRGLIEKDLRLELRGGETVGSVFMISAILLVIFYFALGEGISEKPSVALGAFWVALVFGAVLGQGRTFVAEREHGCLTGLLLAPSDRSAIYLAKVTVNLVFLVLVEAVLTPMFLLLYGTPIQEHAAQAIVFLALASVGLCVVGTLVSTLGLTSRNRELLLPILLFPLLLPVVIAAVEGTAALLPGADADPPSNWLRLLAGYDIVFLAVSIMLFDFAIGE